MAILLGKMMIDPKLIGFFWTKAQNVSAGLPNLRP